MCYETSIPKCSTTKSIRQFHHKIYWIQIHVYCHGILSQEIIDRETQKYKPLINSITTRGFIVDPLILIIARRWATTWTLSMKTIETKLKISKTYIKNALKKINTISIYHAMSILVHERKIENNQPLPINPP